MTTIRFQAVSKSFLRHHHHAPDDNLWAVRDVSFTCQQGEVLGLIGRNGCGKSTLLKLAAGVTSPTAGTIRTCAQIAPMLELGAGFHPDLTGRENIRLNGSLLGMGRHLSASKMDEIVAFAELEAHIDTPVKHFSSGMAARLGFAVAVHSPAQLLLVDEVLSVGDRLFQQKCLARMQYLRAQGTTILLVSHDDWWIRNFCTRALFLEGGRMLADTSPEKALQAYELRLIHPPGSSNIGLRIGPIEIYDAAENSLTKLTDSSMSVRFTFDARLATGAWVVALRIRRVDGVFCAFCMTEPSSVQDYGLIDLRLEDLHLVVGKYWLEVAIEDAASCAPLVTQTSEPFIIEGPFDERRGFEGVLKVKHDWTFVGRKDIHERPL